MTERDIQRRLIDDRYARGLAVPNFTPRKWFECDVLYISEAGYFTEFEIKLTRQDFSADRYKRNGLIRFRDGVWLDRPIEQPTKHELLARGSIDGPSRFYFVTPSGLLTIEDIPGWAGWIEVDENKKINHSTFHDRLIKKGPKLHKEKASPSIKDHILDTCYWRMTRLWMRGAEAEQVSETMIANGIA